MTSRPAEETPSADRVVRTVLGDIDPAELGHTQPHEHVLSDMSAIIQRWGLRSLSGGDEPSTRAGGSAMGSEFPASVRRRVAEPITLENYDWVRRNVLTWDNLRLLSEDDAIAELQLYRNAGGQTVVDSTPIGMGRDPLGCARVSRATGVQVVLGGGYYVHDYHPPGLAETPAEALTEEMCRDVQEGVGETRIRSGLIGEIGLSWPVHPAEEKVLRAAARAQVMTGAPLQIHPGRDPKAPFEAVRVVADAGGQVDRTIVAHIDRTLSDVKDMVELAKSGCYLEFDLFGQESSYYAFNPDANRPNDATRIDWLIALFDAGFGDRLLVSQDICQKVYLRRYGGPGFAHILEQAIPLMRRKGISDEQVRLVTVDNPASILTLAHGGRG